MMFSLETFRKMINSYVYYTEYDDFAILDAYNHLEKTEKGYRTNIKSYTKIDDETIKDHESGLTLKLDIAIFIASLDASKIFISSILLGSTIPIP